MKSRLVLLLAACLFAAAPLCAQPSGVFMRPSPAQRPRVLSLVLSRISATSNPAQLRRIALDVLTAQDRLQPRLNPLSQDTATINRGFALLARRALAKVEMLQSPPGSARAIQVQSLAIMLDTTRQAALLGDEMLEAQDLGTGLPTQALGGDGSASTYAGPPVFTYPQAPALEPSWKRAARAERAQLGSIGQPAQGSKTSPVTRAPQPKSSPATSKAPKAGAGGLSEEEIKYLAVLTLFARTADDIEANFPATNGAVLGAYSDLKWVWDTYLLLTVPPRFQAADALIRGGMMNEVTAFQLAAEAVVTDNGATLKLGAAPYREAREMFLRGVEQLPLPAPKPEAATPASSLRPQPETREPTK